VQSALQLEPKNPQALLLRDTLAKAGLQYFEDETAYAATQVGPRK